MSSGVDISFIPEPQEMLTSNLYLMVKASINLNPFKEFYNKSYSIFDTSLDGYTGSLPIE